MITNIVLHYSEAQRVSFYLDRKLSRYKDMMPKDNPFYDDLLLKIYGLNCCDLLAAFFSPGLKHFRENDTLSCMNEYELKKIYLVCTCTTKLRSHKIFLKKFTI